MTRAVAVIGMQWGDEGKGKIVDRLTDRASVVSLQARSCAAAWANSRPTPVSNSVYRH